MSDEYQDLHACIFGDISERRRSADIFNKELGAARKSRWKKAFNRNYVEDESTGKNRKATIVIELLMQASDVAHPMQHWHVYSKWNEKLPPLR